jgi:glycine cleavage system transcriptional repressor
MLVLSAPEELDESALRQGLAEAAVSIPLDTVLLTEVEQLAHGPVPASHSISVYGADHPGIVHGVAQALAERNVNIVDLTTRVIGENEAAPLYAMLLDVALPPGLDEWHLELLLAAVAEQQGVDVSVRAVDSDVL